MKVAMSKIDSPDSRLKHWLGQRNLRENPFAIWNAEREAALSDYFVDVGQFDELLHAAEPCVVFAGRGCGKTAQRRMLATQCRPLSQDSGQLAINYTVSEFERVLGQVNGDVNQVRSIHHVKVLMHSGLNAFFKEMTPNRVEQTALVTNPEDKAQLAAYVACFAPHLRPAWLVETPAVLDLSDWLTLLHGFAGLVGRVGLESCVVLVDGLDELPAMTGDLHTTVTFLASLLGMLPLIECPGWAFKFFLPRELESSLRAQAWFRTDRLRLFPIVWDTPDLSTLIKQRLTYYSTRTPPYKSLAQLCEDELAPVINQELVKLAGGPRVALMLASSLLQRHCQQPHPGELISFETWKQIESSWEIRRLDFGGQEGASDTQGGQSNSYVIQGLITGVDPVLSVAETGLVVLGKREITKKINPRDHKVLACLYKHRNDICPKETLIKEAWPGESPEGVSDQTIAAAMARLRGVLRDQSPNSEYIETIKGRGYRLHPGGFRVDKARA